MPVEEWTRKEATGELEADEYEVDAIVAEKLERKKRTFLVKWKVCPGSHLNSHPDSSRRL